MLKTTSAIKDLKLHAIDGEIGSIEDLYFDDQTWAVRYLIVNTGNWLTRNLVLVSPVFLETPDFDNRRLRVALTKKQIEGSPDIDTRKPVSRQHETAYFDYYGSGYYWGGSNTWGSGMYPNGLMGSSMPPPVQTPSSHLEWTDSHLRSAKEVAGYNIEATDGEIGHVQDFIVDTQTWGVRYLEVKTRNWLPGKVVLLSPQWIEDVVWLESKVTVAATRDMIKTAEEFVESRPITREYESALHAHYGRPPYWMREMHA